MRVIPVVTALPSSPADGDEVYLQTAAMATDGAMWHLRYRAASSSAYKWEFIGGPRLYGRVQTNEACTSSTYAALATPGPSIVLPLAGDYDLLLEANPNNFTNGTQGIMSFDIGATAAVDADSMGMYFNTGNASVQGPFTHTNRRTFTAAATLTAKYKVSAGGQMFLYDRTLAAIPVRVG
jgi:hypothetical protein